jgi:hypothetical protein
MPDREPEAWESTAPGPFLVMRRERGVVSIEALGEDRFRVTAEGAINEEGVIVGHDAAGKLAEELAERLGDPA